MADTETTNYGLVKPDVDSAYAVGVFNDNVDIIDTELKKVSDTATEANAKTVTVDTEVKEGSTNPVSGGAVYTAEAALKASIEAVDTKKWTVADISDFPTALSYFTNDKKFKSIEWTQITLATSAWDTTAKTASAVVGDVTASNSVIISPAPDSLEEYGKRGVYASTQEANKVTFVCKSIPTTSLTVYIMTFTE